MCTCGVEETVVLPEGGVGCAELFGEEAVVGVGIEPAFVVIKEGEEGGGLEECGVLGKVVIEITELVADDGGIVEGRESFETAAFGGILLGTEGDTESTEALQREVDGV
jgi:hypothetical protein